MNGSRGWGAKGLLLLVAILVAMPVAARGEVFVEGYMGGTVGLQNSFTTSTSQNIAPLIPGTTRASIDGNYDPAVIGGLKLGTWFVREGFLGVSNYPDWAKYFGFYLDFSFQRLNFPAQIPGPFRFAGTQAVVGAAPVPVFQGGSALFSTEGVAPTLAFMFAGRYGWLPDSEVPFGRLQPYLAVGPGLMFVSQQPSFRLVPHLPPPGFPTAGLTEKLGSDSATTLCLAVDAGVRYMMLKNVSLDIGIKYRYAQPSFSYEYNDFFVPAKRSISFDPTLNLISGTVGVGYHF